MFLYSKNVLKVYFMPSRKNKDFVFLPVPILPGWVKILYLNEINFDQIRPNSTKFDKIGQNWTKLDQIG
jgi:hypothetical protein